MAAPRPPPGAGGLHVPLTPGAGGLRVPLPVRAAGTSANASALGGAGIAVSDTAPRRLPAPPRRSRLPLCRGLCAPLRPVPAAGRRAAGRTARLVSSKAPLERAGRRFARPSLHPEPRGEAPASRRPHGRSARAARAASPGPHLCRERGR